MSQSSGIYQIENQTMPAATDLNGRIALAKGWTYHERRWPGDRWDDPKGKCDDVPDFVGTLEGVSGMLRELGPQWAWGRWHGGPGNQPDVWICFEKNHKILDEARKLRSFWSPDNRPSDCVGKAYMSMKETADGSE